MKRKKLLFYLNKFRNNGRNNIRTYVFYQILILDFKIKINFK